MDIPYHISNNVPVFEIPECEGALIMDDIDDFLRYLLNFKGKTQKIAFDMSSKSFLNSTGLGELVAIKDGLIDKGIELVLLNPSEKVESLINMVGLDQFFSFVSSEDELI